MGGRGRGHGGNEKRMNVDGLWVRIRVCGAVLVSSVTKNL